MEDIIIIVYEIHEDNLDEIVETVKSMGVEITSVIKEISIICGKSTLEVMSKLIELDEIESVNLDTRTII